MTHRLIGRSLSLLLPLVLICPRLSGQGNSFDYKKIIFGTSSTLNLTVESVDTITGAARVNGVDSQAPTTPFTWNWGDGMTTSGFFPQTHTYSNVSKNYFLTVTAHYSGGKQDSCILLMRFVGPTVSPIALSPDIAVRIPVNPVTLGTRLYTPPRLGGFADRFFTTLSRSTVEYIASAVSSIEKDFVNDNIYLVDSKFEQLMLRDSAFQGAYSLWYTNPVAFGVGDAFMQGHIGWTALFHEMGHNYTLNCPANYYYGGRIDGNANAIYSETMAQVYAYAAGYELVNHSRFYGLSDDLAWEIGADLTGFMMWSRDNYNTYISGGKKFTSWNDPVTQEDDALPTFSTIAFEFCRQAETEEKGYRVPLKRMTGLLQGFNPSWWQKFDQGHNTAAADTFRSTLLVTAMSYGFAKDLRADFRNLKFPISDQIYNDLYASVTGVPSAPFLIGPADRAQGISIPVALSWQSVPGAGLNHLQVSESPFFATLIVNDSTLANASKQVGLLSEGATYHWRVRAKNSYGFGGWSDVRSFVTLKAQPIPPLLSQPANGSAGVAMTLTFSWGAVTGASKYRLQISLSSLFNPLVLDDSTLIGVSRQVGPLLNGAMYYWRVCGFNASGWSQFSPVWSFTTLAAPSASTLIEPIDSARNVPMSPTLSWSPCEGAIIYQLQVSSRFTFSANVIDDTTLTTTTRVVGPLSPATTYYWRVRGRNAAGYGPYSTIRHFITVVSTSLEQLGGAVPTTFALHPNFPNPFNPSTTIRYQTPLDGPVLLKVYNVLGEEIATIVSGIQKAGFYQVQWTPQLPSGAYFYRLLAGIYIESRKMILVK
ncbi:MAG: T9SS type A sorting domain-containing protein [Ignavibacteriales bacterium]|nr:T9SS type A sorting domain-containing protein [Ignavibacteriales bacterium]